ncbi:MAG: hypothetical protein Q9187_002120 [Circinaria calcarea]
MSLFSSSALGGPSQYKGPRMVESQLQSYCAEGQDDKTFAVLKAFVEHLPGDGARNIMEDILECKSDEMLRQIASNLRTGVLGPMKSRRTTPVVILSPQFISEQDLEETFSEFDDISSRNNLVWLKKACLQRDGARCVITGCYDLDEAQKLSESERAGLSGTVTTQAAHILPFSLGGSIVNNSSL